MPAPTDVARHLALFVMLSTLGGADGACAQERDGQPLERCRSDGSHCRWWRSVGGDNDHDRDIQLDVGGGYWAQDRGSALPLWLSLRGALFDIDVSGLHIGLVGGGRIAGADRASAIVTSSGLYLRSSRDATRLEVTVDIPIALTDQGALADPAGAQRTLLTGLARGVFDDLSWLPLITSGWVVRASLSNRAQLGTSQWFGWINIRAGGGSASLLTPAAAAYHSVRTTGLAALAIELLVGDGDTGLRLGARVSVGFGATLPVETTLPIHAALVAGWDPDDAIELELSAGFTTVPVVSLLEDDTTLTGLALPSIMLSTRFYPLALLD